MLKMLQVMTEKGLVHRDASARTHVYDATRSEPETQRQLIMDLLDKAFDGSAGKLVLQALSSTETSATEPAEIRRLLDRRRKGGA